MLPEDVWPVSVNDHLMEPAGLWTDRLPAGQAAAAPRAVELEDGSEAWRIGQETLPVATFVDTDMLRTKPGLPARRFDELSTAGYEPHARLQIMNQDQVAAHTLLPHAMGFAGERLRGLRDPQLWNACVQVYNDFLLREVCAAAPERLVGLAVLPLADFTAAEREIERVAALGARGVSLPNDPPAVGIASYHDAAWVRLMDACDAADLPIFIHISTSGRVWAKPGHTAYRPPPTLVTAANLDILQTACDLAFSPLLTERPLRKVVFLEGNLSWAPYLEERADFATTNRRADSALPGRPAGQVLHEQILGSFLHDPEAIRRRHEIGLERFLWQSDFPHVDSLWPASRSHLAAQLAEVPDGEARMIAETNARRLLRLPQVFTPPSAKP